MAIPKRIIDFLKKTKINYKILEHKKVFTAFDKSQTLKVSPKIIVKTLILKLNKSLAFLLLPADKKLDLRKVKKLGKKVELATENFVAKKIKGVKLGAIPPFGNLWKTKTLADKSLKRQKKIIINSGDWKFSFEISPKELEKAIDNLVWGDFAKK